ncbi:unnamed protein product [Bursaphelenchus okinawaensis]|uniref:UBA domain-containing protein n=1 Tax=Bursaphelenchus okinawaensis TaxID=465554 RepID=A0A811JUT2_9BILA|nr:unnamed protein product [Bursaphelenchus okinawaensis]CAG9084609.1 unnamed protein product [Bursaphelenchus okinawaensis]
MVFAVFSSNPRVEIEGSKTIQDLINTVKPAGDSKKCVVFFRGQKLSDDQIIDQIAGIKPQNALRVLYDVTAAETEKMETSVDQQLVSTLENLQEPQVQKIADVITKPDFKRHYAAKYSKILENSTFLNLLADFSQWQDGIKMYPEFCQFVRHVIDEVIPKDAFGRIFNPAGPSIRSVPPANADNRITADALQNAFASVMGGNLDALAQNSQNLPTQSASAPNLPSQGTEAPPVPPVPRENPMETYRSQLDQFREFGFTDDGENVQYLIVTQGNFEMALELLIRSREEQ